MRHKLLFCCLAVLSLTTFVVADNSNDLNFSFTMNCDRSNACGANPGSGGGSASAYADFNFIGLPFSFLTYTGNATDWTFDGVNYYATFGYGGTFQMMGPDGLTFTGVVTSGSSSEIPGGWNVDVNYTGQWSNGLYATGEAGVAVGDDGNFQEASLRSQVSPEPSSLLLLGTGVAGVFLRKRFW